MQRLVTLSLLLVGLAGCTSLDPPGGDGDCDDLGWVALPNNAIEEDHDHNDQSLHAANYNLHAIGYHSGYGDGAGRELPDDQGFSELFVRDGLAFLGRRGGDEGGFVILDVSDPTSPARLGDYPGLANYDMESTFDNAYVFFVSQYLNNQQPSTIPPDDPGDAPRLIHVVDIRDPRNPMEASAFPVPTRGVHTITYHRTDEGREFVAAQTYDFLPDPSLGLSVPDQGPNPFSQRVLVFEFVRQPNPTLVFQSQFVQHPMPPQLGQFYPHDVAIQKHPLTGQLLMYVAYWDLGAYIVDISNPRMPRPIAQLTDFAPSSVRSVHLAAPANQLVDGRHVTVTEPELSGGEPESGQYTIFDTTDPANPKRLGHWTLPGKVANPVGLRFSPHNFEVDNGLLVLGHYHAGVWVVDVSDATNLATPVATAFAYPTAERGAYGGDRPSVWTALWDDGYVYASDIASGLHVFRYGPPPRAGC
jgi:hypothetical protein